MTSLPRVLIIDDLYGRGTGGRNEHREDLCFSLKVRDVTHDVAAEHIDDPVAEAVFYSGQSIEHGVVQNDLDSTIDCIRVGWRQWPRWALLLLDLHFKTGRMNETGEPIGRSMDREPQQFFGLHILDQLIADPELREIPVVILSSMERDNIEERLGAHAELWDFVDKDSLSPDRLRQLFLRHGLLEAPSIIGRSVPFLKTLREVRRRAQIGTGNTLLLGETGTGKELLARYIHEQSNRPGEFVTLLTNAVTSELIEDTLFGHDKGAFTGANSDKLGAAELADNGTLFIDEFGNMPKSVQQKLMRLLDKERRETQRLGSHKVRHVDVQVVLATNKLDILASTDFHHDLLARLNDPIELPPLRNRREDIPLLVEHFLRKYERQFNAERRTISEEAMDVLAQAAWPDNVRGLELMLEQVVSRYRGLRTLSVKQLGLPEQTERAEPDTAASEDSTAIRTSEPAAAVSGDSIDALVDTLEAWRFDESNPTAISGRLPDLQRAYARLLARYLHVALLSTRKPTPDQPEGEVEITPAVKLITGNAKLSTSKAADYVKRVLRLAPKGVKDLLNDMPVLREAYDTALRLRPTRPGTKNKKSSN